MKISLSKFFHRKKKKTEGSSSSSRKMDDTDEIYYSALSDYLPLTSSEELQTVHTSRKMDDTDETYYSALSDYLPLTSSEELQTVHTSRKMDDTDETYYSALFDYEGVLPISDENYASELSLQETIFSSLATLTDPVNHHSQVQTNIPTPVTQEPGIMTVIKQEQEVITAEGSSGSSTTLCMICMDEKPSSDIFQGTICNHSYCTECTVRYVATKIRESAARIKCPDVECTQLIEPYMCRDLIPNDAFDRWEQILCESVISSLEKFYCPFKDCSAMMVKDSGLDGVTQAECSSCHRLFCAKCEVAWHVGMGCDKFKRIGKTKKKSSKEEDAMLIKMAKNKKWRRCPRCKFYIDKVDGCKHMRCRCGFEFCYRCGSKWRFSHICKYRTLFCGLLDHLH